jgi:hypothetical protein
MNLNKITATAAMAGGLGAAAFGIGAGFAQADPGPNVPGPGPNVPGPNVPGPPGQDLPGPNGPGGPGVPGQPVCNSINGPGPGANCNGPGSPLPPGQDGLPPPGHYNDPGRYGIQTTWAPPGDPDGRPLPVVFNPQQQAWGVYTSNGFQVLTPVGGANSGVNGGVGTPTG